ncbi:MAG: metallopeptidase TldD-related protein [Bryobacteraceae bacterium]|nr:metallopeptidase TldD-related protein [Bryobacteraceae bacterium]MDW8378542.1 metallopeptidase TldD-related protein [Bryobacterales bacterium]
MWQLALLFPLIFGEIRGLAQNASPLLETLSAELQRNFLELQAKADPPPYFIAYSVVEEESQTAAGSFGSLLNSAGGLTRSLDVTVRVGSPKLDNYHRMRGDVAQFASALPLPVEDNPNAIRRRVWLETDRVYRLASQRLIRIRANTQVKASEEDPSDDFSAAPVSTYIEPVRRLSFSQTEWNARIRRLSQECNKHRGVLSCLVLIVAARQTKYFVNSEGTRLQHGRTFARLSIQVRGKASDGMDLLATNHFDAVTADRLPKEEALLAAVKKSCEQLTALLKAPPVDPFVGPAILSGSAAGVFFHEIFGHRIEGHRQKDESEGQTFTKSVGKPVLPEFLSVISDPTRDSIGKVDLSGSYRYDDEGVPAQAVRVVEQGILKSFLMSRSPIRGFPTSNGHGRRQAGAEVVSRQSNLIVESSKAVEPAQLRMLLLEEIKRQGKPYGLYFEQVTGGFTTTARQGLQAFTVIPLIVYRVYADGRPDELVRGVSIVGTPLASFSKILATSNVPEVFNGICGAESGNVPVSAVSPALLVSEIEIQRQPAGLDSPPLLPRPSLPDSADLKTAAQTGRERQH